MELKEPVKVFTASSNEEAHSIAQLLTASGIPAHAVDDHTAIGGLLFGMPGRVQMPQVFVDKSTVEQASQLLVEYEKTARSRNLPAKSGAEISAQCEDCGTTTMYPSELDGTTQNCPQCHAYVDVGELDWDGDVGEEESDD